MHTCLQRKGFVYNKRTERLGLLPHFLLHLNEMRALSLNNKLNGDELKS